MRHIAGVARVTLSLACLTLWSLPQYANAQSALRFYGDIDFDANRIKVKIDPHVPADVGASDFTIDFRMKTAPGNTSPAVACGNNSNWVYGDIIIDRDRYSEIGRAHV